MTSADLVYVLEKVKAACKAECGTFHTWVCDPGVDHEACLQLAQDGLIKLALEESDHGHFLWELP